ncbi:TMEM175 family protein [Phenylobacterium sp.]|jgi:hypothetical protein|uniref:TMEM175 family protein n=1 Tax=Phenylobacterium sp. TaxID=1871053 RepID=UPI002F930142
MADEDSRKRLDQFVDAAFGFAVTLLLITGAEPPRDLADLRAALLNLPSSAAAFVLIVLFWSSHRAFGRVTPVRDASTTLLSLAVVFTVLVYVYPLRFLMQALFHWLSLGRLPGRELIDGLGDLASLYQIYGLGFAVLSGLVAALFACSVRLAPTPDLRDEGRSWRDAWLICAGTGLVSMAVALLPLRAAPWLPPSIYSLIPLAIWLRGRAIARAARRSAVAASDPVAA